MWQWRGFWRCTRCPHGRQIMTPTQHPNKADVTTSWKSFSPNRQMAPRSLDYCLHLHKEAYITSLQATPNSSARTLFVFPKTPVSIPGWRFLTATLVEPVACPTNRQASVINKIFNLCSEKVWSGESAVRYSYIVNKWKLVNKMKMWAKLSWKKLRWSKRA